MIRLVLLIAGIITVVRPAQAASVLMEQAMELPGFAMWADSGSPGLLLAVVNGKDSAVMGFGTVRPKEDHPEHPNPAPDGRTLIRLGSITKVFTGEMLASLAVSGRMKLTDTLASYLPGVHVPSFNGRPISLLDLATHSAALPREIGDVPQGRPPFDWPTRAERMAWLDQVQLQWSPGTISSHSNIGFDLLSDALEQGAGERYAQSGGGGGFITYVALAPGRDVGVFVAVNRVNFSMFVASAGAANQLVGELATR